MSRAKLLLSLLLLVAFARAQKERPLPKDLPPYGPITAMVAPTVKPVQLEDGLTVWLVPRSGFPKVALALAVRGGLAVDPKERPGLAELLAASLTQGTTTRSARQIAEQLQGVGGDLSARARQDDILVSISVLAEKLNQALPVLADVVTNASFPDAEVSIAKRNLSNSLRSREAEPSFLADRALAKVMFGEHPYAVTAPTQASIEQTTAADLRREFGRRFQPRQALLVLVGAFDPAQTEITLRQGFHSWRETGTDSLPEIPKPAASIPHSVFLVSRPGSVQTTLLLGAQGPTRRDPDYEAVQVSNAIYGGMFGSRLVLNIREDKGYTYSPFARLRTYREAAYLFTQADVRNPVTGATFNEINYELNRMTTTEPSDSEMTQAKRYLVGIEAIGLQSGDGLAQQLAGLWVDGLPAQELERHSEKIGKVTAADASAASKKYFAAHRSTVIAVGEEKVVQQELLPFGLEIKPAP